MHIQKFNLSNPNRYYSWRIVTYVDLPLILPDLLKFVSHYAYICHNKEEVSTHYHLLITFNRCFSGKKVLSLFPQNQNTFIEPTNKNEMFGDYLYLTHSNDNSKVLYEKDLIVSNDLDFYEKLGFQDKKETKNVELYEDIVESDFNVKYLSKKYGRDFIINFDKYKRFRDIALYYEKGIMPCSSHTCDIIGIQPKLENENIKF